MSIPTTAATPSDQQIRLAVTWRLLALASGRTSIGVTVREGQVTLTGRVSTLANRWAAGQAARGVPGVRAVINDIAAPPLATAAPPDADVAAQALRALAAQPCLPVHGLEVVVRDGWVTLQGEVGQHLHKLVAERVAHRLPGIRGITNIIRVRSAVLA
jgi:osmotically-inducible protein OsmY